MIQSKLIPQTGNLLIERRELLKKIDSRLQAAPSLFVGGGIGCGKTTVIYQYLKSVGLRKKCAYYRMDEQDNQYDSFRDALIEMAASVEIPVSGRTGRISDILLGFIEKSEEQYIFVFDQIGRVDKPEVLDEIGRLIEYLPSNGRVILLSEHKLPSELRVFIYNGRMATLSVGELLFNQAEIRDFFRMRKIDISVRSVKELYKMTGGWPGAVSAAYLNESLNNDSYFLFFVPEQILPGLSDREKLVLNYGAMVPFFDSDLCRRVFEVEVTETDLLELEQSGLLRRMGKKTLYSISPVMRNGIMVAGGEEKRQRKIIKEAALWYEEHGYFREMLECMEEPSCLRQKLNQYAKELISCMKLSEMKKCLDLIGKNEEFISEVGILFLQGWAAMRENDMELLSEKEKQLLKLYRNAQEVVEARLVLEHYLNLLYLDSRIGILQWIEKVKEMWIYEEKLQLFTFSDGDPVLCTGVKNFASLFRLERKEGNEYLKIWNTRLDKNAQTGIRLAKYQYWMQIRKEKQVYEEIQTDMDVFAGQEDAELLAAFCDLLMFLNQEKGTYDFEEDIEQLLEKVNDSSAIRCRDNCNALNLRMRRGRKGSGDLGRWMLYGAPEDHEEEIHENPYLMVLKAKGYFEMEQYNRAVNLCEKLIAFYEKKSLFQILAELRFLQAVSLYKKGELNKSKIQAAKALTIGMQFRYVELYGECGDARAELIRQYQQLVGIKDTKKKRYYYGDILKASQENYLEILFRYVQKRAEKMKSSSGENEVYMDTLTMTELTILQYIGQGFTNQEIAGVMNIKITTVKSHVYNIYRKLGVASRVQALNVAKREKMI